MNLHRVIALVLAAGQGRRMGRPKMLLPYRESTIIETVLDAVLDSSVDGLVVVANPLVEEFLRGRLPEDCYVVINDDPDSDMRASVQIGVAEIGQRFETAPSDGVMVLLGDQPEVTGGLITTCAEAWRLPSKGPGILVATYKGRRGHPTVFAARLLRDVADWPPDRKLSDLIGQHVDEVRELPITACPMPIDVNTPEDYKRLRQ